MAFNAADREAFQPLRQVPVEDRTHLGPFNRCTALAAFPTGILQQRRQALIADAVAHIAAQAAQGQTFTAGKAQPQRRLAGPVDGPVASLDTHQYRLLFLLVGTGFAGRALGTRVTRGGR